MQSESRGADEEVELGIPKLLERESARASAAAWPSAAVIGRDALAGVQCAGPRGN